MTRLVYSERVMARAIEVACERALGREHGRHGAISRTLRAEIDGGAHAREHLLRDVSAHLDGRIYGFDPDDAGSRALTREYAARLVRVARHALARPEQVQLDAERFAGWADR